MRKYISYGFSLLFMAGMLLASGMLSGCTSRITNFEVNFDAKSGGKSASGQDIPGGSAVNVFVLKADGASVTDSTDQTADGKLSAGMNGGTSSLAADAATQALTDIVSKFSTKAKSNSDNPTTNENNTNPAVTKPTKPEGAEDEETQVIEGTEGASKPILWKPVSDNTGKLAVLLPNNMGSPEVSVTDMDGVTIETGDFQGLSNPDRATYRFDRPGGSFPAPCLLKVGDAAYLVKAPTKRNESLPTYLEKK